MATDRILEVGFEDELRQIISILPNENRQTMLFSATQTTKVEDLARISLKPGPLYINVDHRKEHSTVDGVEQGYIICEADKRFLLLFALLKKNQKKKIIVFFSSCNSVKYYSELLNYVSTETWYITHVILTNHPDRSSRPRPPWKAKAAEAHEHVLRVL